MLHIVKYAVNSSLTESPSYKSIAKSLDIFVFKNCYQIIQIFAKKMDNYALAVTDSKVITMEVRLLLLIAEHDLSLCLMDSLLLLLRSCFPLYDTLKQVLMGKQKGSNIIRFGIMSFFVLKKRDYHSLFTYCKSRIGDTLRN